MGGAMRTEAQRATQRLAGTAWLAREFLTWILVRSGSPEPIATTVDGDPVTAVLTGPVSLLGASGAVVASPSGDNTPAYSAVVRNAVARGKAAGLIVSPERGIYKLS